MDISPLVIDVKHSVHQNQYQLEKSISREHLRIIHNLIMIKSIEM